MPLPTTTTSTSTATTFTLSVQAVDSSVFAQGTTFTLIGLAETDIATLEALVPNGQQFVGSTIQMQLTLQAAPTPAPATNSS